MTDKLIMDKLRYNNTEYYRLQMSCPVCLKNKRYTPIACWTHYEDGGHIYIGSNGTLYCTKCGRYAQLRYWRFICPNHSYGCSQYYVSLNVGRCVNSEEMLSAMGLSLPMIRHLSKIWLCKFIKNI